MTIQYQVKKGDTLSSIAEKHTTTASAIARYNHIANPNRILLGQLIKFESSVQVIFKDKQSRPISGLSVRLESQATGVRRIKTSTDGSLPPVIFSSMSDFLRISIVRGDGTEKNIANIRPSGEKRVVTVMAPSVRVAATSAPRQGGTPRATQIPAGAAAVVRPNPPTVAPQQRQNRQLEKSGAQWVARFPTSQSLDDLEDPFKINAKAFVAALRLVEVSVRISATYRPNERSYLMHFCAAIARGTVSPGRVPSYPNVNIDWLHLDENGKADMDSAKAAAKAMKDAYGIGDNPVAGPGRSNHNIRLAMDITISNYVGKKPKDKEGKEHEIKEWSDIVEFGKKFDVIWFGRRDRPHWSPDGH